MSTEQTTEEIEARRLVKSTSMPEQRWQDWVFLVILILVGIGGMAALYYKLEHPADTRMIEDLSHGKNKSFLTL
jgi:nitrate reductase gamma subunit